MSSGTRTSQTPNFSFQRSSTPIPYSFGKPALNCCGGSLRTFGNMNRPVAASAAAVAAENAPQARPIHARRVKSGDVSSGSRVAAALAAGAGARAPADAAVVVFPARSGIGAAGGLATTGLAACAPAPAPTPAAAAAGAAAGRGTAAGAGLAPAGAAAGVAPAGGAPGPSVFVSSA